MEKPAVTKYEIHPLIKKRWSPRTFADKTVEDEKIKNILEAARWSPSAFNEQPWRFVIGRKGSKSWENIYNTLIDFNQKWTKTANVLGMIIGKKNNSRNNKPNITYQYDTGQSAAYLTFQATQEGLFMHQMSGFSKEKAIELLEIPEGFEPIAAFALGYMGPMDKLDPDFQKMEKSPRERKNFNELFFEEKFGNALNIL